jgi:hypothetical protein
MQATQTQTAKATIEQADTIHRVNLRDFLVGQDGKFVSLDFIKQDNRARTLNGRLGVVKHLKGGDDKVTALNRPYLTIFDVQNSGYRAVNLATVQRVRAQQANYVVLG